MVKVIVADRKLDCEHLLGQFLDESHYDTLVEEDCDVYAPASSMSDSELNERKIIFKFRKNFFNKEEQDQVRYTFCKHRIWIRYWCSHAPNTAPTKW